MNLAITRHRPFAVYHGTLFVVVALSTVTHTSIFFTEANYVPDFCIASELIQACTFLQESIPSFRT